MTYDQWKTTNPNDDLLSEGEDFLICDNCNCGLSLDENDDWICERCDPRPPQHDDHVERFYRSMF